MWDHVVVLLVLCLRLLRSRNLGDVELLASDLDSERSGLPTRPQHDDCVI